MARRFPVWYFFERCSERIEVYSRLYCFFDSFNFFPMLLIHSAFFVMSLSSHILLENCFVSLSSGCGCALVHSPLFAGRLIFRCFGISYFICIVLFCLGTFCLPSFACTFWFISSSCMVCFNCCIAFLFSFQPIPASFLCFIIFACCRRFVMCVSSRIFHPGFEFLFVFFLGEHRFFRRLLSLLHRLVCLIPWCCSLRYGLIIRLVFFVSALTAL